jgi:hypothetical protein
MDREALARLLSQIPGRVIIARAIMEDAKNAADRARMNYETLSLLEAEIKAALEPKPSD